MPRTSRIRIIAFGLLWLALASSALQAMPAPPHPQEIPRAESGDLLVAAWKWLVSIVAPHPEPADHDAKADSSDLGSQLDPDGND